MLAIWVMETLLEQIFKAGANGKLLESTVTNLKRFLDSEPEPYEVGSVIELIERLEWSELNDRFFRTLAFGTGGLRGKSIGKIVTKAESGRPQPMGRPEFPCTGTNAMNFYNISRATQGLVTYVRRHFESTGRVGRPAICICHDTRFFSREFAELASKVISEMGCDAYLFEGARSTPELSFAVRFTNSQAGINITASHNPPEYNGFKVYFDDGSQVVEPHASGIIECVNAVESARFNAACEPGRIIPMGREIDEKYMERLMTLPIEPELMRQQRGLRVVFTPLHGVGGVIIKPMLERLGIETLAVPEQEVPDGRFPTVQSPNPENAEALTMAVDLAQREGADLVIATDPDADRMGIAVRDDDGKLVLLTGNQTGSILCWHRVNRLFTKGILNEENASRAVVIKTYVTTDLQKAIAQSRGVACVETLTGFKYIGQKLGKYEKAIPEALRENYRSLPESTTRELRLEYSRFYVFGGEESYGYSASDFVRDKDGNSAAVMIAEAAAFARSKGLTLAGLLDEIYREHGFYYERGESLVMEGAEGAAAIRRLVESYKNQPPEEADGTRVLSVEDFSKGGIQDSEGEELPLEDMIIFNLEDGRRVAVRPSGTEPKIKYYLFARRLPEDCGGEISKEKLKEIKREVADSLELLWQWLRKDVEWRLS